MTLIKCKQGTVTLSATTAVRRELEELPFTVVESKGLHPVFYGACKYGLVDVKSSAAVLAGLNQV